MNPELIDPEPLFIAGLLVLLAVITIPFMRPHRALSIKVAIGVFVVLVLAGFRAVIMQWLSFI